MSSADYRDTEAVVLSKLYSILNVFRSLRCHDKGSHPFFLIVPVVEKLVGRHTGRPIGCIVSSGDERICVTLRVRGQIGVWPGTQLALIPSNKSGVVEANERMVSGWIFEIHKSVQTKAALGGARDQSLKIFYLCGAWPTLVTWLTVFLRQTFIIIIKLFELNIFV